MTLRKRAFISEIGRLMYRALHRGAVSFLLEVFSLSKVGLIKEVFTAITTKTWIYWITVSLSLFLFFLIVPSAIVHSFTGWNYFDSTYFSMVTFTTVGFGDLTITDYSLKFLINVFTYFR